MVDGVFTIPLGGRISGTNSGSKAAVLPLAEFIAGPENRLLACALRPCMDDSAALYSPLVLYGPHGAGKSHIAQGLADWWSRHRSAQSVRCLPAAEFAREHADAHGQDRLSPWRRSLETLELFVLEDIGRLAAKHSAQQELAHLLDVLADREALVIVTARMLPSHSTALTAALRSRLTAGLAVAVSLPGPMARRAIVEKLAAVRSLDLSKRLLHGLADAWSASVPMLASALLELELKSRIDGHSVNQRRVRQLLNERANANAPDLRAIAMATARHFGLTLAEMKSPKRSQPLVSGRGVAMYLARSLTGKSYQQIGAYFGGRDHTTVLHACRQTEQLLARDGDIRQVVGELKRQLNVS